MMKRCNRIQGRKVILKGFVSLKSCVTGGSNLCVVKVLCLAMAVVLTILGDLFFVPKHIFVHKRGMRVFLQDELEI